MESLGWKHTDYWNNRKMYELTEHCTYLLFEHNGSIGLYHDGKFHYYSLNSNDIERLTDVFKAREEMMMHPKDYTLYDVQKNSEEIIYLMDDFENRK